MLCDFQASPTVAQNARAATAVNENVVQIDLTGQASEPQGLK